MRRLRSSFRTAGQFWSRRRCAAPEASTSSTSAGVVPFRTRVGRSERFGLPHRMESSSAADALGTLPACDRTVATSLLGRRFQASTGTVVHRQRSKPTVGAILGADHRFPREAKVRSAEAGRLLSVEGSDAIGKAIARRMPPASSCMTTDQPGRTSSPPRPAGLLPSWRSASRPRPSQASRAIVSCGPVLADRRARS